jgi:hypothetical protein
VQEFIPSGPLETAVLFLIFNRPDTTSRVFEEIRKARPPRLYIAGDGPRSAVLGDEEAVKQAREIVAKVDWPCELYTYFQQTNLGCMLAVSEAINWFFEGEDGGIILEDDCLPDPSFFWYCEGMLNEYSNNKNVMHIGGYKPATVSCDYYSISFTRATHVWGWATWKNRWEYYSVDIPILEHELARLPDYEYFQSQHQTSKRKGLLNDIRNGSLDTWDYQWNFAVRTNNGLGIRPCVNLVSNIGQGHLQATHTRQFDRPEKTGSLNLENLRLPPWTLPNRRLEKEFEESL